MSLAMRAEASHVHAVKIDRITGIDAMRFVAIIGVFFIHASGLVLPSAQDQLVAAAALAARFAVPFFFIVSGYLLSRSPDDVSVALAKSLRRILLPFVAWSLIYILISQTPLRQLLKPVNLYHLLIGTRPAYHLWFLPSLAFCTVVLLLLRRLSWPLLFLLATGFYSFGLAFGAYHQLLTGHDYFFWNTRNGPFFGFPFMVVGLYFARRRITPPLWLGVAVFICGAVLELVETALLGSVHDQLVGTLPFGVGAFMIALRLPNVRAVRWSATLGRYSMGIYAAHLAVLTAVVSLIPIRTFSVEVFDVALALALTTLVCMLLAKVPRAHLLFR